MKKIIEFLLLFNTSDGDPTGGGHLSGVGQSKKTEFPPSWSADDILNVTAGLITSPKYNWMQDTGQGKGTIYPGAPTNIKTKKGKPVDFIIVDQNGNLPIVSGVEIKTVVQPGGAGVKTSHPVSGSGVITNP